MATRDYVIRLPRDVMVRAACEDLRPVCEMFLYGWDQFVNEGTELGQRQAAYFRSGASGREFRELGRNEDGVTIFRFASRQRCFTDHKTRPARFYAGGRQVPALGDWIGDLDDHVTQLHDQIQKG